MPIARSAAHRGIIIMSLGSPVSELAKYLIDRMHNHVVVQVSNGRPIAKEARP